MLVAYVSDNETIVTMRATEEKVIAEFFTKGGRSLEDYDRIEAMDTFWIQSSMRVSNLAIHETMKNL